MHWHLLGTGNTVVAISKANQVRESTHSEIVTHDNLSGSQDHKSKLETSVVMK